MRRATIETRRAHGSQLRSLPLLVVGLTLMVVPGALAQTPPASPSPSQLVVVARGPFGTVPGQPLAEGAALPDASTLDALDAYGRGATVSLVPQAGEFDSWHVTAFPEPVAHGVAGLDLGSGTGPAHIRLTRTGLFLVRLDAAPQSGAAGVAASPAVTWLWRIGVPDRRVPTDGDPYPPAPRLVLRGTDRPIRLYQGSGCYVGTCGDIGMVPPARSLPTLQTAAGSPLVMALSDGSAMTAWEVTAVAVSDPDAPPVVLAHGERSSGSTQVTLPAPGRGRWLLTSHVVFDRDRGSFDGYARVLVAAPAAAR